LLLNTENLYSGHAYARPEILRKVPRDFSVLTVKAGESALEKITGGTMAVYKPFKAVRPALSRAEEVAALPYDVMNSEEARECVKGRPWSFLHVDKAEVDLDPSVGLYDASVYQKASENLQKMIKEGVLVKEEKPVFFIYREQMGKRIQAGIVGCASIDDYLNKIIKKHELTRADKEADRIRHVDVCNANTGPIFLTFRSDGTVEKMTEDWMASHKPLYDFTSDDGVRHTVYRIDDGDTVRKIEEKLDKVPAFYIADGHHRAASAVRVGQMRRKTKPDYSGEEEFNYFLSVLFPSSELSILDYNRVVKDLNGKSPEEFLREAGKKFDIKELEPMAFEHDGMTEEALEKYRPSKKHETGVYMGGKWYLFTAHEDALDENDPVARLDVSILQNNLLSPVLGIGDPRTDERISFIGGIRGLKELVRLVDEGAAAAFAMYPTTLDDLMAIADAGKIMPPKSTWFEPKLRSGLFIHELS